MSDLRNWEKNNGALTLLSSLLKTKKAGAIGACAALLFAAGSSFAADNGRSSNDLESIPVASSSWTSPSGRAIVDLKAKSASKVGKRAQYPIRQTQGLVPAPVAPSELSTLGDELLEPSSDLTTLGGDELLEPSSDLTTLGDDELLAPSAEPASLGASLTSPSTL
ncbi:MAG: hypothetical protein IKY61_02350, partial [Thermoguttaceae bacterium]|nr:hypothetical protein [Thermoguttaceae bacterium]